MSVLATRSAIHLDGRAKVIRCDLVPKEDPFACFDEWASEADTKGYASL